MEQKYLFVQTAPDSKRTQCVMVSCTVIDYLYYAARMAKENLVTQALLMLKPSNSLDHRVRYELQSSKKGLSIQSHHCGPLPKTEMSSKCGLKSRLICAMQSKLRTKSTAQRKSAKLLPEDINHLEVLLMGFFRTALERTTELQCCVPGLRRHVRTKTPRWLALRIISGAQILVRGWSVLMR